MAPAILLMVSWAALEEAGLTDTIFTSDRVLTVQKEFFEPEDNKQQEQIIKTSMTDTAFAFSDSIASYESTIINDPYTDNQWALEQIGVPTLWQITCGDPEIIIAVLDTGIDCYHEDLNGKIVTELNFTDSPTVNDLHGHGTHIAGIIVASLNNNIGIAGFAPECKLMNVKVADDTGKCRATDISEGIIWATDNGASIINISLELAESLAELEAAIDYAWNKGVLIIAAAGNNGSNLPVYPAFYENSIAVSALRQNDTLAPLSNYGDWVDLAAPGFNIYSTLPGNNYGYKSGTSFAAAYTSGMAALLFDIVIDTNDNGRLNDEVREALESGCYETGVSGTGFGRIDAGKSLQFVSYSYGIN